MTAIDNKIAREIEGINRFAKADRSDPFTLARCLAHHKAGIADSDSNGLIYDATAKTVERKLEGGATFSSGENSYHAIEYHNVKRV